MSGGPSLTERVVSLLFPGRCLWCGRTVDAFHVLCPDCARKAPSSPFQRQLETGDGHSLVCFAPLPYEGGITRTIYRFKFKGKTGYARSFARLMAEIPGLSEGMDCISFVPMTGSRRRKRGYDQAEVLANALGKELSLPVETLLEKKGDRRTQHRLTVEERKRNVRGSFQARKELSGKRILLTDDIVTTGATLAECARVLYRAGAAEVRAVCAANAELKGRDGP